MEFYAELIFNNPGITAKEIAEKGNITLKVAYKHIRRVERDYKCVHRNSEDSLEVFLLEKKKGSRSPFTYNYRKIDAVPM